MHVPMFPPEEPAVNAAGASGPGAQPVLLPPQTAAEEETRYYELEPLESADTPFVTPFQPSRPLSLPASPGPKSIRQFLFQLPQSTTRRASSSTFPCSRW